ncbi:MAG: hypothetical protein APF77_05725 [Clostridia bacterium BRH_c25]|nr:MAG: hypothetical protein APF77_05725 [Clostridia bacterium BRH_c25]
MCCGRNKSCCMGECAEHCNNSDVSVNEISLDAIVELEIHYSESKDEKMAAYIFKSLYCLTNIQRKELRITGLEGNRYDSLNKMKLQVIACLTQIDNSSCELYKNVDVSYIRDDV